MTSLIDYAIVNMLVERYERVGQEYAKLPVCGLFALAFLSGVPFETCRENYRQSNNKPSSWKGRTHYLLLLSELDRLNVKYTKETWGKKRSLASFVRADALLDEQGTYFVRTGNHFMVIHKGYSIDQAGVHTIIDNNYMCRRRISHMVRIHSPILK